MRSADFEADGDGSPHTLVRLQTSLWTVAALSVFLGTLGVFGLGVALWLSRDMQGMRRERDDLGERVALLEAARRPSDAADAEEGALSGRVADFVRESSRGSEERIGAALEDLSRQLDVLAADVEALGEETDLLLGREPGVVLNEGLASYGQDQALPLGEHAACFLTYTRLGTSQNSACDLQHDAPSGTWTLYARSAECRAACLDWR